MERSHLFSIEYTRSKHKTRVGKSGIFFIADYQNSKKAPHTVDFYRCITGKSVRQILENH